MFSLHATVCVCVTAAFAATCCVSISYLGSIYCCVPPLAVCYNEVPVAFRLYPSFCLSYMNSELLAPACPTYVAATLRLQCSVLTLSCHNEKKVKIVATPIIMLACGLKNTKNMHIALKFNDLSGYVIFISLRQPEVFVFGYVFLSMPIT